MRHWVIENWFDHKGGRSMDDLSLFCKDIKIQITRFWLHGHGWILVLTDTGVGPELARQYLPDDYATADFDCQFGFNFNEHRR